MNILIDRRRAVMGAVSEALPYDAQVEYLVFDGSQYIDTGFVANTTTTRLHITIIPTSINTTQAPFGSRHGTPGSTTACNIMILNNQIRPDWAAGNANNNYSISNNTAYEIDITRGTFILNSTTYTYSNSDSIDQQGTFFIGNLHNGTSGVYSKGFIGYVKSAQLYSNDVLIRDYIPVRKNGVGYYYDRISGQLFGDANGVGVSYGGDV